MFASTLKVLDKGWEHEQQAHKKVIGCDYEDIAAADSGDVIMMMMVMMTMMVMRWWWWW